MYYQLGADFNPNEPWCSSSHPSGSCSPLSGVCKPMTNAALLAFKEMQNQLNRVAVKRGYSKVDVDGRLGPAAVSLYNKIVGSAMAAMSCDALSVRTLMIEGGAGIAYIKSLADSLGAPASVSPPITSRPSVPDPKGGPPKDPPALAITDFLFSPMGMLALAGLGYAGYRYSKKSKKSSTVTAP